LQNKNWFINVLYRGFLLMEKFLQRSNMYLNFAVEKNKLISTEALLFHCWKVHIAGSVYSPIGRYAKIHARIWNTPPGIRATRKLVLDGYVWPSISKDITSWTRACVKCQQSKVNSPIQPVLKPAHRFNHVHIDLVGPLPPSEGYLYLLTCVNRYTRRPEAIPMPDISAETVARAFVTRAVEWVGGRDFTWCPSHLTQLTWRFDWHIYWQMGVRRKTFGNCINKNQLFHKKTLHFICSIKL
jgi:hypothetical protein